MAPAAAGGRRVTAPFSRSGALNRSGWVASRGDATPYGGANVGRDDGAGSAPLSRTPADVRGTAAPRDADATPATPRGTARDGTIGGAACSTKGVFTGSRRGEIA